MRWRSNNTRRAVLAALQSVDTLVVFDTETTGLSAATDRVVEFGAIKFAVVDGNLFEMDKIDVYIKPPFSMPEKASAVNGITDEFLADKPSEDEVFPEIEKFMNDVDCVAGYNVNYDIGMMSAMYKRMGKDFSFKYTLDVLEMARDFLEKPAEVPNHKLGTVAEALGVDKGIQFHGALQDVTATFRCFKIFLNAYVNDAPAKKERIQPNVFGVSYWQGYRGHSRQYVHTSSGAFYYDILDKNWGAKEKTTNLEDFDMEFVQKRALELTNCGSLVDFAKFHGSVSA